MSMCEPAAQTINDLAEALLASRSAITQAVVLLENRGLVQRSRARGERVDRVTARLDASTFERDFDPTGFADARPWRSTPRCTTSLPGNSCS